MIPNQADEPTTRTAKAIRAIFIGTVYLVLGLSAYADQVNCVKWQDSFGTTVGTYCRPFRVKAGTGITFTDDTFGAITINSTASVSVTGTKTYIDAVRDCGAVGDGVTDDGAVINACLTANAGKTVFFPKTQAATSCDYFSSVTLNPKGDILGAGSFWNNAGSAQLTNVNICFAAGVTGMDYELTPCRGSCYLGHIGLIGGDFFGNIQTPTKFIVPNAAAMDEWNRDITSIQRASNVLTVTVKGINGVGEKLFQQVGSTVAVTGVVGDSTLNGLCVIAALSGLSTYGDNASTFTCPQNGSDSGPFTNDGTTKLPTTGANASDGIRVCGNFYVFDHISVMGFARWGINADANAGEGCTNAFADDFTIMNSSIVNNQVGGFFTRGTDSSVDLLSGNAFYYNGGFGAIDGTALGNTYINNNFSNNGAQWASATTPATKSITSVNRTSGTVVVVLASADTNIRLGSCVVIAGVTDSTFNNTSGQCYIVTSFTNSTHFSYIQPGNPGDASSSGGTSRYAKFSETYLSTGLDSGSYKMGVDASASADSLLLNNYIEGGQPCKLGASVIAIQGTNTPCASVAGSFTGSFINTQYFAAGSFGANITHLGNKDDGSGGYELTFHAGATVSHNEYLTWDAFNNARAWRLDVLPTGTAGSTGYWRLSSNGVNADRIKLFGSASSNGDSVFAAVGTGEVALNKQTGTDTAGTGGTSFYNGVTTKVANISSIGLVTPGSVTVGNLPSAASNPGAMIRVSDSTAVSAEGQTCVGSSSNNALAFSNGSVWKCF